MSASVSVCVFLVQTESFVSISSQRFLCFLSLSRHFLRRTRRQGIRKINFHDLQSPHFCLHIFPDVCGNLKHFEVGSIPQKPIRFDVLTGEAFHLALIFNTGMFKITAYPVGSVLHTATSRQDLLFVRPVLSHEFVGNLLSR